MNISGMVNKIEGLRTRIEEIPSVVNRVVDENQNLILSLNKDQMLLGRGSDGESFTPGYLEDPFFKSKEAAKRYANMKYALESKHRQRIENPINYPSKDKNTPNLIVTGPFQDSMFITAGTDSFTIDSKYEDSGDIEAKYNNQVFGLAPLSKEYFYNNYVKLAIIRHLKPIR